jgi:nucleoid DNA-binding protein
MNTAELVDEVAAQTGMAKDGVRKVLDAVLGAVQRRRRLVRR